MLYIHENNIKNKIDSNYNKKRAQIQEFYTTEYLKFRRKIEQLDFESKDIEIFKKAIKLIEEYLVKVDELSIKLKITPQSKFRSTFIEEISTYLFAKLEPIQNNTFGIYNKNIYAGMKINNHMHVDIMTKDVDFCIGKKVLIKIDEDQIVETIIPIICVEVKTYLDATMFGEVQYSSKQIKNASPNAKTYVFMEHNEVAKEKIIAARYDNVLNDMFVLRKGKREDKQREAMDAEALLQYYLEICEVLDNIRVDDIVNETGRMFKI